jgi:hypothetical protein
MSPTKVMPERNYDSPIWSITSYYNPCCYRRRFKNFRHFRNALRGPLLVVELGNGATFELSKTDADILVQLPGECVLFQKERLLNVALTRLPAHVRYVAWLDCDVVLSNSSWLELAVEALQRHCLIQLFENLIDLDPGSTHCGDEFEYTGESMAAFIQNGGPLRDRRLPSGRRYRASARGGAWAGRRSLLERHRFYDAMVLGGGDLAFAHAAFGRFAEVADILHLTRKNAMHYLDWAQPFFEAVPGNIGYLKGDLFHYWHGDWADRRYDDRNKALEQFDFDPYADIAIDEHGSFRWSSDKPALHAYVREHFKLRNEDGSASAAPA